MSHEVANFSVSDWLSGSLRLATTNISKSESDQEDNDDLNDNDWSYGAEKKGEDMTTIIENSGNAEFDILSTFLMHVFQPRRESPIR